MGAETWSADRASRHNTGAADNSGENEFPVGLRVLVVDDDRICLLMLDRMLRECLYKVRTCERAAEALEILRENKDGFDVVISDVHMPDMDGFKLLESVGLEMDLPVIMMSANRETSAVMKGIKHGACDYLVKPVRIEELRNIWQHVIRRKHKDLDGSDDRHRTDDGGEGLDGSLKTTKKRKDNQDEDDDIEQENEDPATCKKPRVVWTVDLHQNFVNAVNQLGIDKAVPKRILELMDVRNLTRENVASHLQKYRLFLKRISGVAHHGGGGLGMGLFGADERFVPSGGGLGDLRTHMPPHAFIPSVHPGMLDRAGHNISDLFLIGQVPARHGTNDGLHAGGPPYTNTANVLNSVASSGLDFKRLSRGIGQLVSLGHNDKVPGMPLSAEAAATTHNNQFLADHNSLLMHILRQEANPQIDGGMLSKTTPLTAQNVPSSVAASNLSRINQGVSHPIDPFILPGEEGATLNSYGLATLRKAKVLDVRPYNTQLGIINYGLPSKFPSQSIITGGLASKGLICDRSEDRNQGLQSVLPDQMSGNLALQSGPGQSWHGAGPYSDGGNGQSGLFLIDGHYKEGSILGQATSIGNMPQQRAGRMPNSHSDLVYDDDDAKPLVLSGMPVFEPSFGELDSFKAAQMNPSASSKPSFSPDDLLASFIKQQQEKGSLTDRGDATPDDYTLGNMYVK